MIATNRLVLLSRRCCRPSSNSLLTHVKHAPRKRLYSQGSATTPSIANKRSPGQHNPKHEVHEGTAALSVGFNPSGGGIGSGPGGSSSTNGSLMDTVLATLVGLGIVFVGGVAYLQWYKWNVLNKIDKAFAPGYDPALILATHHIKHYPDKASQTSRLSRKEQDAINNIVHGHESGYYYMLLGPKGTGKGTMILDAMAACQADGVSMCEAHPDLEVFRLRLGKALDYEYFEDSQTGLFQRRDPKEGGPRLDIERALNKLEKVALRCVRKRNKPLVLVINNVHHFKNDEEGHNMLLQLQQNAEAWAASGIVTLVFSSDDFWPFHVMRKNASRMTVMSIPDLNENESFGAASHLRSHWKLDPANEEDLEEIVSLVGGRLSYLSQVLRVSRSKDMVDRAKRLIATEKGWLLSKIGLIPDCDDDVMDEQKWSSCSWLLLREFVKLRQEQIREREEVIKAGITDPGLPLPVIPYWKCRRIMTRADFMEELDHLNIISIDVNLNVRPNSMLILHAACEVVKEEGFDELLDNVRARIDEIESLHRTRELTFKDVGDEGLIRLSVDKGGTKL
ncbi:hypothetical protein AX14_011327 [Amanita brunnescens Koide BX004]|nr:hypothetical protein AX14_011327 [Amanita brunnescens Koide BX004]